MCYVEMPLVIIRNILLRSQLSVFVTVFLLFLFLFYFFVEGELVNDVHTWKDSFNSYVQVHKLIGSAEFVKKTNHLQCRIKTESLMFEGKLCRLACAPFV